MFHSLKNLTVTDVTGIVAAIRAANTNSNPFQVRSVLLNYAPTAPYGILATVKKANDPLEDLKCSCELGFVDCVDGFVRGSAIPCADANDPNACSGNCCLGDDACTRFTGVVCKDTSCNGDQACEDATVPVVVNSCQGKSACKSAGYNGMGAARGMVDSCQGDGACGYLGTTGNGGGIRSSCKGNESCFLLGFIGFVGNIINSCQGNKACGLRSENQRYISIDIENCCNKDEECEYAKSNLPYGLPIECFGGRPADPFCPQGYVKCFNGFEVGSNPKRKCSEACGLKCCNGDQACDGFSGSVCKDGSCSGDAACYYAIIPDVVKSCIGDESCREVANQSQSEVKGIVGRIVNSCKEENACFRLASKGKVGEIRDSCIGKNSCVEVGNGGGSAESRSTVGDLIGSCQGEAACNSLGANNDGTKGEVGEVRFSCIGYKSCNEAGRGATIQNILNSCQAEKACNSDLVLISSRSFDFDLKNCCKREKECNEIKETDKIRRKCQVSGYLSIFMCLSPLLSCN